MDIRSEFRREWNLFRRRSRGRGFAALGLAALFVAIVAGARWIASRGTARVTISASAPEGVRHQLLLTMIREAQAHGLEIESMVTSGSDDAIAKVNAGELDYALVLGGRDFSRFHNVRQVAGLHVEPLNLLVKSEHADAVARHLSALKGKVVDLGGGPESATYHLARDVLALVGLGPDDYKSRTEGPSPALGELDRARLPDALFITAAPPSSFVHTLVVARGYQIIPFPFHEAFVLSALAPNEFRVMPEGVVRREYIYDAVIPAACYCIDPPMPPLSIRTLGMRLLIVANNNQSPDIVERLLDAVFTTRIAKLVQPPLDIQRMEMAPELAWHPGALHYLRRNQPLLTGELISELANAFTIAAPTIASLVFLRQWVRQRRRLQSEQSFEWYIFQVAQVERQAIELETQGDHNVEQLIRLNGELGRLKTEALHRFAEGQMDGEVFLGSFLTHVSDARSYLTRLIIHSREISNARTLARSEVGQER
jgi:TRAP-type uncharacterized transport system substrate-binding protein